MIKGVDVANVLSAKVGVKFTMLIRMTRIMLNIHTNSKVGGEGSGRQIETQK